MKVISAIALVCLLASCKKEEPVTATCPIKVYMRVEVVNQDGTSTYSPIIVTNIK